MENAGFADDGKSVGRDNAKVKHTRTLNTNMDLRTVVCVLSEVLIEVELKICGKE